MDIEDEQLDEFLTRVREEGLEPVTVDSLSGENRFFALETSAEINGETFEGEVDYEIEDDGIVWYVFEVYLDHDDERRDVLDASSANLLDTRGELLYEYNIEKKEVEDELRTLREIHSEVY